MRFKEYDLLYYLKLTFNVSLTSATYKHGHECIMSLMKVIPSFFHRNYSITK